MNKPIYDPNDPDFDENPEWTEEDFARARPAREVLYEIFPADVAAEMLKPKPGRPKKNKTKEQVTLRLDSDVLSAYRRTGPGWQTRLNRVLKLHLDEVKA